MALKIQNTLTREKDLFEPLQPGRVNMYVCGPTVYDYPHIGHAKSYVSFDIVVRYLRRLGYDVLYVQNITDVGHLTDDADAGEDKIGKRAAERRLQPMQLVETFTREYFRAMDALGCVRPDISPRATGHVPEMIELIERLIEHGHAYESDGSVYFDVESFRGYGKLSRRRLDDQESSGRVEPGPGKRNAADFALWKSAAGSAHLMRWNSPWGVGFPGWHIECSAMAMKYLGVTLDIHGAGVDNIFPHNEDEIAQSECANHAPFARYWRHNGSVLVGGEKMSKSKGNFKTVLDEIERHGARALRFWVVGSHYRSPIDYTDESVQESSRALRRLDTAIENAERYLNLPVGEGSDEPSKALEVETENCRNRFFDSMDDDFNTPAALATLFGLATEINRVAATATARTTSGGSAVAAATDLLRDFLDLLGVAPGTDTATADDLTGPLMDIVLAARASLRKARDFTSADQIRSSLGAVGITVEDRPDGSTWRRSQD